MANTRVVQRAMGLRGVAPLKERRPERLFDRRLKEPWKILREIEDSDLDQRAKFEARRMFVVALATAFELYWREFFRVMIDQCARSGASLTHLTKTTVTLGDIATVIGERLTLGELVSCAYSFQGAEALGATASTVLKLEAFGSFRKMPYRFEEVPYRNRSRKHGASVATVISGREILDRAMPAISHCYSMRNETVHNLGTKYELTMADVTAMYEQVSTFNIFFGLFIERQFQRLRKSGGA